MTDPTNDDIDATIDQIETDALTASCARIDTDDADGSAPPACLDEPDITDHKMTEIHRDIASIIASKRSAARGAIAP